MCYNTSTNTRKLQPKTKGVNVVNTYTIDEKSNKPSHKSPTIFMSIIHRILYVYVALYHVYSTFDIFVIFNTLTEAIFLCSAQMAASLWRYPSAGANMQHDALPFISWCFKFIMIISTYATISTPCSF